MQAMTVSLHDGIGQLELALQVEGNLVLRSLRAVLNALAEADEELAREVIAADDGIDRAALEVHESIHRLLARQAPVAVDLRQVLAMLHVNLHLERAADECVTIAKLVRLTASLPQEPRLLEGFEEMGSRAEEMIRLAVDCFLRRDLLGAEGLVDLDELIDRANRRVVGHVLAIGHDRELREWGVRMVIVSRCLERVGDHAVDIGEQAAYVVTGEFREWS
jgi:phosphate transport system protein